MSKGRGLYEALMTRRVRAAHADVDESLLKTSPLSSADAADRIALHISRIVQRAVECMPSDERVAFGVRLTEALLRKLNEICEDVGAIDDLPIDPATILTAIVGRLPDGREEEIPRPLIPLLDTTLLTNAPGEPRIGNQLLAEIYSADRIDVVMAFIRRSGIAPLVDALRRHCEAGRELRILTTTYTASTEMRALEALRQIGARIRISYDVSTTRLHAKAWLFHRHSGFSTAYIGSSNLTHSAQISGLEWNVRVSGVRNQSVIEKSRQYLKRIGTARISCRTTRISLRRHSNVKRR